MIRRILVIPALVLLLAGCSLSSLIPFRRFTVPSESMQPTIKMGAVITAGNTDDYPPRRGDVIVFDAPAYWHRGRSGLSHVSRVIGVPGAEVECCHWSGRLLVDGVPLDEPYLAEPPASEVKFRIRVPQGRIWVMSDNRHVALDSRVHQGDGGDGTIAVSDVIGVVNLP
ncbi:signal peptidase I [Nonomuraea terrae]|uniref:signal peptidase I n=1 Tax=Nonomuraea terrae TaxID=2530383 RepID=UPI0037BC39F1